MTMTEKYTFSGHDSFFCRSLWLKKGYDFVKDGKDFNSPNAVIDLGVGKNMVSSIRYWMRAFGLIKSESLTPLANYIFDDNIGKDPYLEDLATLWLLHFSIVTTIEATAYNWIFLELQKERKTFDRATAQNFIKRKISERNKLNLYNENTVKKDISTLLLNYVTPKGTKTNEDFSGVLIDLDLIRLSDDKDKSYSFNIEGKRQVTPNIFLYAILKLKGEEVAVPYDILQKAGLIFCMDDMEIINLAKEIDDNFEGVSYSDVAGIRQLIFTKQIDPKWVLDKYYDNGKL